MGPPSFVGGGPPCGSPNGTCVPLDNGIILLASAWVKEKVELQDFLDHMYELNKQFHVYSITEIPKAIPMT
jgi:hypothetical protein